MPAADGQTTARSRRAARRVRRREPPVPPRVVQQARAQQAQYASQGRAVQRAARHPPRVSRQQQARARRSLGFQPQTGSFKTQRGRIVERKRQAQRALPARPMPHVPVIRHPTPQQTQAAQRTIARAITQQETGRTPRARATSRREILREIQTDPRHAQVRRAAAHYNRVELGRQRGALGRGALHGQVVTLPVFERTGSGAVRVAGYRRVPAAQATDARTLQRLGAAVTAQHIARNPRAYERAAPATTRLGIGPATVRLPTGAAARAGTRALAAATTLDGGDLGPWNLVRNAGKDVGALAAGTFVGGYTLAEAGTKSLLANAGLGSGRAADEANQRLLDLGKGIVTGTAETFRHPVRSFEQHPLLTPLTVAGNVGAVGRIGGAAARGLGSTAASGGVRGALARAGSTVRPPVAAAPDAKPFQRTYSKDLTRKAAQVAADRGREPLRRPDGSIVTTVDRGREVPVLKATSREAERHYKREGDFLAARANSLERTVRDEAAREMKVRGVRGARAKDLVAMVVEGTITTGKNFERDLTRHRDRIAARLREEDANPGTVFRHKGEVQAARERLDTVNRALSDKRVLGQKDKIVAAGEQIGRKLNEREQEAIELGILHPTRAGRSRRVVPAIEHLDARHFTPEELQARVRQGTQDVTPKAAERGQLRAADGKFLSNAHIDARLRELGRDPESVAYLPHRHDVRGARAFHTQFRLARSMMEKPGTRTGSAYARGTTEASRQLIQEQGVRQATQVSKARQIDRAVSDHGLRHPAGRDFKPKEALEAAERLRHDTGEEWVPIRRVPTKAGKQVEAAARGAQTPGRMESLEQRLLNSRIVTSEKGSKANVVLVPKTLVDRLNAHLAPAGDLQRMFQYLNRPFRMAVLPQPRWLTGNFVEPFVVRLTGVGSGVNVFGLGVDLAASRRVLRQMERSRDPKMQQAAKEIRAQQFGGMLNSRGQTVRRTLDDLPGPAARAAVLRRLPVTKQIGQLGNLLLSPARGIMSLNRVVEGVAQRAAFGKQARRDMQDFTGSWVSTVRLGQRAVDEAGRGLTNTATQKRFMDAQHELLGKYEGFSPRMRALTQSVMPFLPWALNAARFIFWTMPVHRTTQTALLQQTNQVVQKDWNEVHSNVPPGSLKFAIPNGKGGWIDLARYTPYGLTTEVAGGGGFRTATSQVLPQVSGAIAALEGRDPFGDPLKVEPTAENTKGTPSAGAMATISANTLAESTIPYLAMARRLREGGGTAYAGSTVFDPDVKPGTTGQMSAARRVFDPFRPVYLRGGPLAKGGSATSGASLLERAAERQAAGGLSERQMDLLERAARRAAGG